MTDKKTEALKALEEIHPGNMTPIAEEAWNKAITAIREALAEQPAQQNHLDETVNFCRAQGVHIKCIVKGCANHTDEGVFVGDLCKPCHDSLKTFGQPAPVAQVRSTEKPHEQKPVVWVDAGDLKKLRKGDVIRVIRNGEAYYSPFRYCGVLEECDYEYYREISQFVYLEVGMATVEKIVFTRKDFTTGAVFAARGDRVEVARAIEAAHGIKEKAND